MKLETALRKNAGIIIVALLIVMGFIFLNPNVGLSLVGATPLSCTQPKYSSTDQFYTNGTFQCTMAASGSGKFLQATISPSDAQNLFGVTTSQPATVTVEVLKDNCLYHFNNFAYPIYNYTITPTRASSSQTGYCICSGADTSSSSGYIGTTPLVCASGYSSTGGCRLTNDARCPTGTSGCQQAYKKTVGVIYKLDPSTTYDFSMRINETLGNTTYSAIITPQNTSVLTPAFRAELLGQLQGQQSCPSNPDVGTYILNSWGNSTPIKYVSAGAAQAVINQGLQIVDLSTAISNGNSYNTLLANMQGSQPNVGQYASYNFSNTTSLQTAAISIEPTGTVSIPLFNLYMNAQTIGVHVPSGMPKILNTSVQTVLAATKATIDVTVLNSGETDSFDVSVKCPQDINPFSTRANIPTNTSQDVLVNYQGAGIVSQCVVSARSVNSPQNMDSQNVKLVIDPFCARTAPNPAAQMVFTQYGCAFVCPNYGSTDVFDSSCGALTNYSRCIDANCTQESSYNGIHCTALGQFMSQNQYMDAVAAGKLQPFIPSAQDHKFFITQVDGQGVCQYIPEYGYDASGQPLNSLVFDYAPAPPAAQQIQYVASPPAGAQPPSEVPAQPPAGTPLPPSQQQPPQQAQDNTWMWIAGAIVVLVIIFGWVLPAYARRK